jgi:hypothetical protein
MTTQTAVHIDVEPGCPIPLATLGRLYGGDERALAETLQTLTEPQRARLALFCNNRQHLRELGLRIAASCEEQVLVQVAGPAGAVLFLQSRGHKHQVEVDRTHAQPLKRKITLAQLPAWADAPHSVLSPAVKF